MAKIDSVADVNIDIEPESQSEPARERSSSGPFRIAVLGDFSGRSHRKAVPPEAPRAIEIDPENFEEVMERMGVELSLSAGDIQLAMRFRELDDFHPDNIYRSLPLFHVFNEARKELARQPAPRAPEPITPPTPAPEPIRAPEPPAGSLLDLIAAQSPAPSRSPSSAREPARPSVNDEGAWDQAIRSIVSRHAIPKADPHQSDRIAELDRSAASAMRAILTHPDFQALEAAWRSIFLLFNQLDTGVDLKIYLIDVSKHELADSAVRKLLVDDAIGTPGEAPWSVIAGLYTFAPSESDCRILAKLASIARAAGAPFVAAIDPRLFGCKSIAETPDPDDWKHPDAEELRNWQALRGSPDARWLGLAMPRFLLRVPYGAKTSPIDSFDFEEMPNPPRHEFYLWANPAIACVCLMGAAFNRDGWDLRPGSINRLHSVAVHSWAPGEVTPQAEIWMTERFAGRMLDWGVMPLASVKHSDQVQLVRFQSIADPPAPLAGPW